MYTPIVTPATLTNRIYQEIIDEITRDDGGAIAQEAIDTAIAKVKVYLTRYDLTALFGDPTVTQANPEGVSATFTDTYLTNIVKQVALWELFALANPNINYELVRTRYEDCIHELERIQQGKSDPKWPYNDISKEETPPSLEVYSRSQRKRNNTGFTNWNPEDCYNQ